MAGYSAVVLFDREHDVGVIVLRNALGGKVRGNTLAMAALQRVVDDKIAATR